MATQTLYESENDVLRAGVSEPEADERAFAIWADELSAYTAEQLDVSKHPATRVLILLDWMGEFAAGTLDTLHEPALLSMDSRALATISKARDAIIALIPSLIEDNAPNLGSGFIDGTISAVLAQCEADQTPILCIVPALIAQLTWLVGVYDAARRWDTRTLRLLSVTAPRLSAVLARRLSAIAIISISRGAPGLARVVLRLASIVATGTTIDSPVAPPADPIVYRQVNCVIAAPCAPPMLSAWSGLTGTYSFS